MSTFNIYKQYDNDLYYLNFKSDRFQRSSSQEHRYTAHLGIISLDKLQENISNPPKNSLIEKLEGPYPIAVRYIDKGIVLVERPPFQMKVDYSPTKSNRARRPIKPVTVWVPWTVTVYNLSGGPDDLVNSYKIYFNDAPMSSLDDRVITNYFCNVYGDGKICLGSSTRSIYDKLNNNEITSFAQLHSFMFNEYFSGGWNADLGSNLYSLMMSTKSPYLIQNYSNLSDSPIDVRAKQSKIKFSKSHNTVYEIANSFYNLSLLTLEETLDMVTTCKGINFHYNKTIKSIIDQSQQSVDSYLDPIDFSDNHSSNYCIVNLILDNTLNLEKNAGNLNRETPLEIVDFVKENSYTILDDVYNKFTTERSMSINLNYEIPLVSTSSIEEEVNV